MARSCVGLTILACLPCMVSLRWTAACNSYSNYLLEGKYYEYTLVSSKNVSQTRLLPVLRHKGQFPYEWVCGSLVDARWGAPRPRSSDQRHAWRRRAGRPHAEDNRQAQHGALCRLVWCASRPPCRTACASAVAHHGPDDGALSGSDVGRPRAARDAEAVVALLTSPSAASASECGRLPRPYAGACGCGAPAAPPRGGRRAPASGPPRTSGSSSAPPPPPRTPQAPTRLHSGRAPECAACRAPARRKASACTPGT